MQLLLGAVAQLVEHRTENPGVGGSNPSRTTFRTGKRLSGRFSVRFKEMKSLFFPSSLEVVFEAQPLRYWQLIASPKGLCRLRLVAERGEDSARPYGFMPEACEQIQAYFAGRLKTFDLPLDWSGVTDFYRSVWKVLLEIPYGQTTSYLAIARRLGKPKAVRAVGQANRNNPLPIIVPCHRVLASDGRLHGFYYGLDMKRQLLALENPTVYGRQLCLL